MIVVHVLVGRRKTVYRSCRGRRLVKYLMLLPRNLLRCLRTPCITFSRTQDRLLPVFVWIT